MRNIPREEKKTLATDLRHRVILQRNTRKADGEGGFTSSWKDIGTYWAAVNPIKAEQVFEYQSINVQADIVFKLRGDITVYETDRFSFDSRYFEILTVEKIQERSVLKIFTCKEVRA